MDVIWLIELINSACIYYSCEILSAFTRLFAVTSWLLRQHTWSVVVFSFQFCYNDTSIDINSCRHNVRVFREKRQTTSTLADPLLCFRQFPVVSSELQRMSVLVSRRRVTARNKLTSYYCIVTSGLAAAAAVATRRAARPLGVVIDGNCLIPMMAFHFLASRVFNVTS